MTVASRATTIAAFGDFSTIEFTLLGIGEPRLIQTVRGVGYVLRAPKAKAAAAD